jgi:hypothetical protein
MNNHPFWRRVEVLGEGDCWPWLGFCKPSGHGLTTYKSMCIHAHRKAWILTHGPILADLCVNHRCDNAACCNPAHMYLGTRGDNMIDRWGNTPGKERAPTGRPHALTQEALDRLWKKRQGGATLQECADEFGVHIATVCRYITTLRSQSVARLKSARLSRFAKVLV